MKFYADTSRDLRIVDARWSHACQQFHFVLGNSHENHVFAMSLEEALAMRAHIDLVIRDKQKADADLITETVL